MAEIAGDLESGQYELEISGDLTGGGKFTTDGSNGKYFVARGGTNAEGPHRLQLHTPLSEGDSDRARVTIFFHPDISPGEYELTYTSSTSLEKGEVAAMVSSDGTWTTDIDGTVEFAETGGSNVTAGFAFRVANRDDQRISVEGRAHSLPFLPRPEGHFVVSGGEEIQYEGGVSVHHDERSGKTTLMMTPDRRVEDSVVLEVPTNARAGSHTISEGGEGVTAKAPGRPDRIDGELKLERDDRYISGTFEFSTSGEQDVDVEGSFEFVELP